AIALRPTKLPCSRRPRRPACVWRKIQTRPMSGMWRGWTPPHGGNAHEPRRAYKRGGTAKALTTDQRIISPVVGGTPSEGTPSFEAVCRPAFGSSRLVAGHGAGNRIHLPL